MAGEWIKYEFWRMETKKVPNGFVKDKDGKDTNQKKYEEVDVQITYSSGTLHITQTPGHNSVDTAGTEFDLSAGTYVSHASSQLFACWLAQLTEFRSFCPQDSVSESPTMMVKGRRTDTRVGSPRPKAAPSGTTRLG